MSGKQNQRRAARFPAEGVPWKVLEVELEQLKAADFDWRKGRVPSYTYFLDDETFDVQTKAYAAYIGENALGSARAFTSIESMLRDIFEMGFSLFNAPNSAGASFTSGGTESVMMALKTARDEARAKRGEEYGHYNVVAGLSAHPCLNKAAEILDLEVRRTPLGPQFRADPSAIQSRIDDKTIMIYASAPCYPFGVFDPIEELSAIAVDRGLWLHVDACWGGFISPFAKKLGYSIPAWDFSVTGVSSISADIHKFGYSAKGASLILYRDKDVQRFERFECSEWPRGTYATPTFLGTRPGGAVASAWAVMRYLGEEGYLRATRETMDATMQLVKGINEIDGLQCLEPTGESNLFGFVATTSEIDIMAVADRLESQGWFRGRLREPLGIHQGVNPAHLAVVDEYLEAVRGAVVHAAKSASIGKYDEKSY